MYKIYSTKPSHMLVPLGFLALGVYVSLPSHKLHISDVIFDGGNNVDSVWIHDSKVNLMIKSRVNILALTSELNHLELVYSGARNFVEEPLAVTFFLRNEPVELLIGNSQSYGRIVSSGYNYHCQGFDSVVQKLIVLFPTSKHFNR